jgi:hypothetical protein
MMKRALSCVLIAALLFSSSPFALADQGAPVAGDLSHLTFTATSGLWVRLLSPAPNSAASVPAVTAEAAVGMGQGVEIKINGDLVPTTKIGKRVVDGPANETRYTFYGIPLLAGKNTLTLTPLGAAGLHGASTEVVVYGPGLPVLFQTEVFGKTVADGSSLLLLHVKALDQWGHAALTGALVKAVVSKGDVRFSAPVKATPVPKGSPEAQVGASAAPATVPSVSSATLSSASPAALPSVSPATLSSPLPALLTSASPSAVIISMSDGANRASATLQSLNFMLGNGGVASVEMVAGLNAGDVVIELSSGDTKYERKFFLSPNVRAPMVVGLATVGVGQVPGSPGQDPTTADGTNSRSARVALYASGGVGHNTLGTLAYDTADTLDRSTGFSAFGQGDALADRPYEIVGDASMPRDDALSNDHLYLRFDHNHSNAIWGEFQAQTGSPDGGDGFNLLVDGAKVELASSATKLMVFNARNNIAYARQIFNPLGLSTLGNLLNGNIVVGSDIVTVVTLDRHSGAIILQTALTPNIDYSIDYNTGQIRFINIPLPFDPNFNPNQIVVQYEYDGVSTGAETTGGRFDAAFGKGQKEHVGIGYVNDVSGTGNFSLLSENLGGVLHGGAWSVEHLTSDGVVIGDQATQVLGVAGSNGSALRAALSMGSTSDHFTLGFDATTAGFDNPFGGLSTPGLVDYHASYTHLLQEGRGQVSFNFSHDQNDTASGSSSQSQAALQWQEKLTKRFTLKAGLTSTTGPGLAPVSAAATAPSPGATASAVPAQVTSMQADVGFDWKLLPNIDLNVDRTADLGSAAVASQPGETNAELGVAFPRKGRLYVREMWSDAPVESFASSTVSLTSAVSGMHTTAIGFERSLGSATNLTTEYDIQQTPTGDDIYSSIGVDEKLQFGKNLHGDTTLQRADGIGGAVGFNLYGLTMSYDMPHLRTSESYQLRTGNGNGSSLRLGATGTLSPDFSLLGLIDDSNAQGLISSDQRLALAYRPAENDRGVTLLQYELKNSSSGELGTHTATVSLDQAFHPTDRMDLAGRYAYKLDGDAYYPAQTQLFGFRALQRIGEHWDFGGEVQYLDVRWVPGASALGIAAETGLRLGDGMRLAFGYNFSGSPDPALAAAPTRRGIYVTLTTVIDRILGWGR